MQVVKQVRAHTHTHTRTRTHIHTYRTYKYRTYLNAVHGDCTILLHMLLLCRCWLYPILSYPLVCCAILLVNCLSLARAFQQARRRIEWQVPPQPRTYQRLVPEGCWIGNGSVGQKKTYINANRTWTSKV